MATTITPYGPNLALAPFPARTRTSNHALLLHRTYNNYKPFLRGSMAVARVGFNSPGFFPDPDAAESVVRDLFGRAESVLYTIADAAVSSSDSVPGATKQSSDWLSGITYYMESVLKVGKRKKLISLILNGAVNKIPQNALFLCVLGSKGRAIDVARSIRLWFRYNTIDCYCKGCHFSFDKETGILILCMYVCICVMYVWIIW